MQTTNPIAFKEWAAVCAALAAGRQSLILRKGGIHEAPGGFRPEHSEFWLLPTRFHEQPAALRPADRQYFDQAQAAAPPEDRLRIGLYAVVGQVIEVTDERRLPLIENLHIYGSATVRERFHYRRSGLFLLGVRVYRAKLPVEMPIWPELAGCRTWVELPAPLATAGLTAVLSDEEFETRMRELQAATS